MSKTNVTSSMLPPAFQALPHTHAQCSTQYWIAYKK